MPRGELWEHDLWQQIYDVPEPVTKNTLAHLYRLILDMRENDVMAQRIAAAIGNRTEKRWKKWHVFGAIGMGFLLAAGEIITIIKTVTG